ncbi:MAG: rhodanese-like domain-containing protein [Lutibacter sp.]|jgi:rhodanese-related sulfurtransferase|nr:rhodanese-like domain-containing protein [Lutibacter sp.]
MADLTQSQWSEQLGNDSNSVILDVRTHAEVSEGFIPNMIHLDIFNAGPFMDKAKQMGPSKNYYIYCRSGARSGQACTILNSLGFKNTFNLIGGFMEWKGEKTI